MNSQEANEMQSRINEMVNEIKVILESHPTYPRIIVLGLTGSGKSSLTCCLTNKQLKIEKNQQNFPILKGDGVFDGCQAGTTKPMIFVDEKNKLLLCDCPGFEDVDGMMNEIVFAFADDYILSSSSNNNIKIKIILVISAPEFQTGRGKVIKNTIIRMKKMFPNPDELRKGIAIVVTKGDSDIKGSYYFDNLNKSTENQPDLKSFCDYFDRHSGQVFTFPIADKEKQGQIYKFADYPNLINFLTDGDYLIDPEHEIAISNESRKDLDLIRMKHLEIINQLLRELFLKMNENYREINNSSTIEFWLKLMHQLMDLKISNINDFHEILSQNVPNCEQYDEYFKQLEEYEAIDSFIDRIYEFDTISSCLQDCFRALTHNAIQELEQYHLKIQKMEQLELLTNEKNEMIKKYEEGMNEQQKKIEQLMNEKDESQKEMIEKMEHMKNEMNNQKDEYEQQIAQMKEEFFNKANVENAYSSENQEMIQKLVDLVEKQENMIHYLANKPPTVIEKDGCLLI